MNTFSFTDDELLALTDMVKAARFMAIESGQMKAASTARFMIDKLSQPKIMIRGNNRVCLCEVESGTFANPTVCIKCSGRLST
tara:strand:- start:463 stop:711 length:249 start_codon:yes stop_codon:yes gene_type:complete